MNIDRNLGVPTTQPTVHIVDDDIEMRNALYRLIRSAGLHAITYTSALDFLATYPADNPGCLLLDMRMPDMSGLELQERLRQDRIDLPIIFLTGHGSVAAAVDAMKSGALDFLEKPFDNATLLERVHHALQLDAATRRDRQHRNRVGQCIARLTRREREVLDMLVDGHNNRAIAERLGVGVRTVETHRANVMAKMEAASLSDLVRKVLDFKSLIEDN